MTKPEENTIDTMMDLGEPPYSDKGLDIIIAYHRRMRAMSEAGIKPPKSKSVTKQSLDSVVAKFKSAPGPTMKRRI